MTKKAISLISESFSDRPALDTAVSRVLLQGVSEGDVGETLRLYKPAAVVAFGSRDALVPGYRKAVAAARFRGFEAVQRLGGGRAAVFHEGTLAFGWTVPDPLAREHITQRFEELATIMVAAFRRLGVDASVGEVTGEYCPGSHSVNARGKTKLMGVGQRVVSGAAHVGGVVVIRGSIQVRDVLLPVYSALGIKWDPKTVGSIEDELGPIESEHVREAILAEFASRYKLVDSLLGPGTLGLARSLEAEHLAPL